MTDLTDEEKHHQEVLKAICHDIDEFREAVINAKDIQGWALILHNDKVENSDLRDAHTSIIKTRDQLKTAALFELYKVRLLRDYEEDDDIVDY